jgi:hypothetical protein
MVFAALVGMLALTAPASANSPQGTTSISFTITTTTNYKVTTGGPLQVNFNSVQVDTTPPQSYSFGVNAKTSSGLWIVRLHWEFGDGSILDVPYCCQTEVSEVQNHAYADVGSYKVTVIAYDNAGNSGDASVTVNWVQPVPEYPTPDLALLMSVVAVLVAAAYAKGKLPKHRMVSVTR